MGGWEEMCVVCGGPLAAPNMEYNLFHEDTSEAEATCLRAQSFEGLEWLDDRLGITASEERVPLGCYYGYGGFKTEDSTGRTISSANGSVAFRGTEGGLYSLVQEDGQLYGLICHTKCCELLERDLHYTLRFHDVWPMLMRQKFRSWLECTDYGGMTEYIDQDFAYQCLYLDGGGWMLQDPTAHHENGERILKVWRAIIQSGFQLVKAEPEDGTSQARNETLVEAAIDESQLQKLCWHSGRRGHLLVDGFIPAVRPKVVVPKPTSLAYAAWLSRVQTDGHVRPSGRKALVRPVTSDS